MTLLDQPERRVEGRDKVTGAARYAADLRLPGLLEVAYLQSPYPHARIVSVDAAAAHRVAGVRAVVAGADVRPARLGRRLFDWPVLAWDRVRFVGDRVAAVAAETVEAAREAAAAIEVEYEELPAILDVDDATAPGAPILHPDAAEFAYRGGTRAPVPHPNVQGHSRHEHGDLDAAMRAAARVFEHTFTVPRVHHAFIEPRASVVWYEDGVLRVVSTNKAPFALRELLAVALGIPAERIVVDNGTIGGDFGGKGLSIDEFILAFVARAAGRPVRHVATYAEELTATNTRHAARITLRTGVDRDARIVAHEARVLFDGGAYAAAKPVASLLPGEALLTLAGYRVPAARIEATAVYTNTVPAGHMRAPGQPQNAFAAESHVDLIASELGLDPFEFRLRNALRAGDVDALGERWHTDRVARVLERARAEAGPPPRGRGVALGVRHVGVGKTSVVIEVADDGSLDVLTGVSDQGGGAHTMLQRVVAAELGLPAERVRVRRGSTAEALYDPGVGGSRVTPAAGGAALAAARALRESGIRPGARVVGEHDAHAKDHSVCAYVIDVNVDRETGAIAIVDALLVADVGTVINPVSARGQLVGGFAFGLGQALTEELAVEDGRVVTTNLGDYKLPSIVDVPELRIVLVESEAGPGPFGARSVGELANPAVAPAIANAVASASGARVRSLPLTAEKVHAALAR